MHRLIARLKLLLMALLCMCILSFCLYGISCKRAKQRIVIGAKNNTEQLVLAEIFCCVLEKQTDLKVVRQFNLAGTAICFNALKAGTIDLYFEYTGTALLDILKETIREPPLYPYVKAEFKKKYNQLWLDPLGYCNQYVLIARKDAHLRNCSEISPELKVGIDHEFATRLETTMLKTLYCPNIQLHLMDPVLLYFSLLNGTVDVISGASTDGRLMDPRFVILEDDKSGFPHYEVAPLIREKNLEKFPQIIDAVETLKGKITEEDMRSLSFQVEFEGKDIHTLAQEYIKEWN